MDTGLDKCLDVELVSDFDLPLLHSLGTPSAVVHDVVTSDSGKTGSYASSDMQGQAT